MKGRIAVLKAPRKPFEIEEYDVPDPQPGAIVLRTTMAAICGSDLHRWRGDSSGRPMPARGVVMGHEGIGVVHTLGSGVTTDFAGNQLREGDRVVFSAVFSCLRCRYCLAGDHNYCQSSKLTHHRGAPGEFPYFFGTFGDFVYLTPNQPVWKAPDLLADEVLAPVNCGIGTIMQGLLRGGLTAGQAVVFQGAGGLGLAGTGIAHIYGAHPIIAIDGVPARLQLARELGATHTINLKDYPTSESRIARVKEITAGVGADIVVELVGIGELVPEGMAMLAPDGSFVEIGNIIGAKSEITPSLRARIVGSSMYRPALLPKILELLVRGVETLPFQNIISHKFALADVTEAFEHSEWSGKETDVIRSVLIP